MMMMSTRKGKRDDNEKQKKGKGNDANEKWERKNDKK
jgi:hypothetical protein